MLLPDGFASQDLELAEIQKTELYAWMIVVFPSSSSWPQLGDFLVRAAGVAIKTQHQPQYVT